MTFDRNSALNRLRDFQVRNVRVDQPLKIGTKQIKAEDVLTPINRDIILGCTDERKILSVIDIKNKQEMEVSSYTVLRMVGGALGLVDAIRNVRVTIQRQEILAALSENKVITSNHMDDHAKKGELTGCGYSALRELPESASVFDRTSAPAAERMLSFEEMGTWRMILGGEHIACAFLVNPLDQKVLDPTNAAAGNSFFALDLGPCRNIMHWIQGALDLNDEVVRSIMVKLTRNNLTTVFILSNTQINEAVYIERSDDKDMYYAGVLHEALSELKEREEAVLHILEQRMV